MIPTGMQELVNGCNRLVPRMDCIANNIANIQNSGFKAERLYYLKQASPASGKSDAQFDPRMVVDYSQGLLQATGNPLDLAIEGDGFFAVQTKEGESYTRKGNFTINRRGELVTQAGDYVLGQSGKISLNGTNVIVSGNGEIIVDGVGVGKLKIVTFKKPEALVKQGGGLFFDPAGAEPKTAGSAEIKSGYLELSNVKAVRDMVEMINIQRYFDLYQKGIQAISDQDKLSTSRIGRLA